MPTHTEDRIPKEPPAIAPRPAGEVRPLWSVMIPAYNCSVYLERTIRSVLAQCPGPEEMQIEVVDDCSTDIDVAALVYRCSGGRVAYYRQPKNVGHLRNFETCINRARGRLIHLLHGDDYVLGGFYREVEQLFEATPDAGAAFTDFYFVDEQDKTLYTETPVQDHAGPIKDAIGLMGVVQRIQTPSMVVKRSVYEKLGGFYGVRCCEDWLMWVRVAANYPLLYSPKHLACYRIRSGNNTSDTFVSGVFAQDVQTVLAVNETSLPAARRLEIMKKARRHWAIYEGHIAHKLYHEYRNKTAAANLAKASLGLDINKTTVLLALKLYLKIALRYRF